MAKSTASASGASSLDGMRVLAVDEDPIHLTTLTQMLQRCGYKVTAKASPEKALREVRRNTEAPFDLVMAAAHTRGTGIDGFALLEHLSNRIPVILFADDQPVETVRGAILGGASDFLFKPLKHEQMRHIWKHVTRWRRNAASGGSDPRKRGVPATTARAASSSGEGGSRGVQQQQQKQCRTTKKTRLSSTTQLHASFVKKAAELLRGTEGYCPRGIREFVAAQGVEITIEQATSHLEIYERDCLTNHVSATPMAISSHYNNSKNYSTPGSSGSSMRSQGATNINQISLPSKGASPVGRGTLGNESYRAGHVGYLHNNANHHGNVSGYGNHFGNSNCNGEYGNGYGHHYGISNFSGNVNANGYYGIAPGGLPENGNMVSASLSSNLAQPVQQPMPTTGLFPRLSYDSSAGGISMSPWHVDDGDDLMRSYLGENQVMQNTAATGMTQGMHGDGAAGQTSVSYPQDLTDFFSWESTYGNGSTGGSAGM